MEDSQSENYQQDKESIRKLDTWILIIFLFIMAWSIGILIYVKKNNHTEPVNTTNAVILQVSNSVSSPNIKKVYNVYDLVVINQFDIKGIIIKKSGNECTILYKNHNDTLYKITLPEEMLHHTTGGGLFD